METGMHNYVCIFFVFKKMKMKTKLNEKQYMVYIQKMKGRKTSNERNSTENTKTLF